MKNARVFNFKSIDDLKNNWEEYKKPLLKEGLFVLRNANLSLKEQKQVQELLGTKLNCYPNQKDKREHHYIEDHSRNTGEIKGSKDKILLEWHIEHDYYENSMVLGIWNMKTFKTNEENGNTVFANATKIFNKLKKEDQEFLKKSKIERKENILNSNFIKEHWFTNEPVVRGSFTSKNKLYEFDNRIPTEKEKKYFNDLVLKIWKEVMFNKDNWIIQKWNQGDLVVVDLQKMVHAVFGGFKSEDRVLQGMFSYEKNIDLFPVMNKT